MTLSYTMLIYVILTLAFLRVTYGAAAKEIKARPDFEMKGPGGAMNAYRYYRHLRRNKEEPGPRLKLLLLAYANLVLCIVIVAAGVVADR